MSVMKSRRLMSSMAFARTISEACDYMTDMGRKRELRQHWQWACQLILAHADAFAVSRALELALFTDAQAGRVESARQNENPTDVSRH